MTQDEILSQAMLLLRRGDIRISGGNLETLSLSLPDQTTRELSVRVTTGPPTPSMIDAITHRPRRQLVVTHRPGKAFTKAADDDRLDLITIEPASVVIGGLQRLDPPADQSISVPNQHRGKPAWGRWAILRTLALAGEPLTQLELGEAAGISQPAVAKNLKHLGPLVHRTPTGWSAADRNRVLDEWLAHYPGPRGATTYWYSLQSPADQARAAADYAEEMGAAPPLVSGDAAADIYAPWRLPDSVRVYLREAVDFTDAGFMPSSREEASMFPTIPEDTTLWLTAKLKRRNGIPLADLLVTMRDVSLGGAADSADAAQHLREATMLGPSK